jgi:hypothetical protein
MSVDRSVTVWAKARPVRAGVARRVVVAVDTNVRRVSMVVLPVLAFVPFCWAGNVQSGHSPNGLPLREIF